MLLVQNDDGLCFNAFNDQTLSFGRDYYSYVTDLQAEGYAMTSKVGFVKLEMAHTNIGLINTNPLNA